MCISNDIEVIHDSTLHDMLNNDSVNLNDFIEAVDAVKARS